MILKITLCGLVIVLIMVIATSHFINKEGFENITNLMDRRKVKGRFIKIEQKQTGCLNLAEIEVYSDKNGINIIKPNMVISQSSPADPAKKLLDGNPDTIGHTSCSDVGSFLLDLGSLVPIYKIVIVNRKDCCRERANGISVSILNGTNVVYKSNPFKDVKGRTSYTELGGNNATMNEYYYTFTLFPPYPNPFGDLPSTMDFDTASNIDVVKGWSGSHDNPKPMLTNETPESCRQMALDGNYAAWGYRKDNHPTDFFKNTCFLYTKEFKPYSGNQNDDVHLTGCLNPGEKVELGCKAAPITLPPPPPPPPAPSASAPAPSAPSAPAPIPSAPTPSAPASAPSPAPAPSAPAPVVPASVAQFAKVAPPATPSREEVIPQVKLSNIGYEAMLLKQRSDLLKDIQKTIRNEIMSERMLQSELNNIKNKENVKDTVATIQGKEYEAGCHKDTEFRCPKNPDGSCPPLPDMTKYIKKDQIPCWGCSIDY